MRFTSVIAGAATVLLVSTPHVWAQTLTTLYNFSGGADGAAPEGVIFQAGMLYGATLTGGAQGLGTVFAFDLASKQETTLYTFQGGADGASPLTGVVYLAGKLYGTTSQAGQFGTGTVYAIDIATGQQTTLYNFTQPLDAEPNALTVQGDMLFGTTRQNGRTGHGTLFAINLKTTKTNVLHKFGSSRTGQTPAAPVLAASGRLYGTTLAGGRSCGQPGCGTIYGLNPKTEQFAVLHSFASQEGFAPSGALAEHNNILYGAMQDGGGAAGTVFAYNLSTNALVSYSVGGAPAFGVAYAQQHVYGSHDDQTGSAGALFDVDLNTGTVKDIYTFTGGNDGRWPGPLVYQNNLLFGVTSAGGTTGAGTLFSFTP